MHFRIGIDIGGTFTDFTILDDEGRLTLWKEETTPDDPTRAIAAGLVAAAESKGIRPGDLLRHAMLVVHGTTIGTNILIERTGPLTGLLCTKGFRDVIYFRDAFKPDRFNIHLARPRDFVDRWLRLGITERINADGEVVTPLVDEDVREAAARFREAEVSAVGVAFLWSIVNPIHERQAADILREELPGVHVLCSAEVLPEIREWERTSATVLSAYIFPQIAEYLRKLESLLQERGFTRSPLIMQNNGGCASVQEILRQPVNILESGPAAAPAAARFYTETLGADDLITIDMGGTSFDVCVIRGGRPAMSRTIQVEHQPIGVSGVEVNSMGAGGGSIAWIDSGGALRIGPRSAGARPGPACYGLGGDDPTVTDANVVLGYLAPDAFLGGRRPLREDLARQAVQLKVAKPLGLDILRAAAGIIQVVDTNMIGGIRAVSIERGIDPRHFLLVAGGGAGGLHAARLAKHLGILRVLIPKEASALCAFGMTVTDVRHDHTASLYTLSVDIDLSRLNRLFSELDDGALERLRAEGFTTDQITLERSVDARYPNQIHELTIAVPSNGHYSLADVDAIAATFHRQHEQLYGYALADRPVEFLHWRVTATGSTRVEAPTDGGRPSGSDARPGDALVGEREAYFEEVGARVSTPVYDADRLSFGTELHGPAIIQAPTTTVLLNPADTLTVTADGSFLLDTPPDLEK